MQSSPRPIGSFCHSWRFNIVVLLEIESETEIHDLDAVDMVDVITNHASTSGVAAWPPSRRSG